MEFGSEQVIVTGAGGWLGRNFVRALLHGLPDHPALRAPDARVRLRCLLAPGEDAAELTALSERVEPVVGDLAYPDACRALFAGTRGAVAFHLAGIIHPRRVREFYRVNVQGTETLLAAAREARARRVVAMSSNSPFGTNPHAEHLFDEHSPYRPYLHYGRSKMQMEQAVARAGAESAAGGLETVLIRAPWFYGPWQPPRQSVFFTMIRQGKGPIVGGGENRRSMSYVDNLSQGLLLAALTPAAAGRAYWIADRRPYTMNEIVDTVERLLEREFGLSVAHKRLRLPGLASAVAYACDWTLQSLGRYHQKLHVLGELNKSIACSVARAKAELDYRPAVALEEGMRRSIRWCLEHGIAI